MMPSSILLVTLQLCILQLLVVAMPMCQLPGDTAKDAHRHLRELGDPFPVHCLQYNTKVSFPDSALPAATTNHSQCRRALRVVYESLQGAEQMFIENDLPEGEGGVTWKEQKLDNFLNLQDQLVDNYRCLSDAKAKGVLSSYFSNVTALVHQQESAACGWQVLRRDLLWVLKSALQRHHACFSWRHMTTPTEDAV